MQKGDGKAVRGTKKQRETDDDDDDEDDEKKKQDALSTNTKSRADAL